MFDRTILPADRGNAAAHRVVGNLRLLSLSGLIVIDRTRRRIAWKSARGEHRKKSKSFAIRTRIAWLRAAL
jgi:hypothetical protein